MKTRLKMIAMALTIGLWSLPGLAEEPAAPAPAPGEPAAQAPATPPATDTASAT